jgi:hypothetical protein
VIPVISGPRHFFVLGLLLTVTAGALYYPSLDAFFDSQEFISVLQPGAEGRPLVQRLMHDWASPEYGDIFFRPLLTVSFMLEYKLWGSAPAGYRIVNAALLVVTGLLAAGLASSLTGSRPASWAAGLLFVTHPGTVVAVEWISARGDILAALFSLAAMLMTVRATKGEWRGPAGALPAAAMLLAAGSKELGLGCFLSLPLIYFLWPGRRRDTRTTLWFVLSLAVAAGISLAVRWTIFGTVGGYHEIVRDPGILLANAGVLLGQTVGVLFPPLPALACVAAVLVPAAFAWRSLDRWRLLLIGMLVFWISGFQSLIAEPAEHYSYMGSAVFSVIFVSCLCGIRGFRGKWGRLAPACLLMVISLNGFLESRDLLLGLVDLDESRRPVFNEFYDRIDEMGREGPCCFLWDSGKGPIAAEIRLGMFYTAYLSAMEELDIGIRLVRAADAAPPGSVLVTYDPSRHRLVIQQGRGERPHS